MHSNINEYYSTSNSNNPNKKRTALLYKNKNKILYK